MQLNNIIIIVFFLITVAPLSPTKIYQFRKASLEELLKSKLQNGQWPSSIINITENPISAVVC